MKFDFIKNLFRKKKPEPEVKQHTRLPNGWEYPTFIDVSDNDGALYFEWCFGKQGARDSWRVSFWVFPEDQTFCVIHTRMIDAPKTKAEVSHLGSLHDGCFVHSVEGRDSLEYLKLVLDEEAQRAGTYVPRD